MSDWAPADVFLLPHMKETLAVHTKTTDSLKTTWVGVTATIAKKAFAAAFWM